MSNYNLVNDIYITDTYNINGKKDKRTIDKIPVEEIDYLIPSGKPSEIIGVGLGYLLKDKGNIDKLAGRGSRVKVKHKGKYYDYLMITDFIRTDMRDKPYHLGTYMLPLIKQNVLYFDFEPKEYISIAEGIGGTICSEDFKKDYPKTRTHEYWRLIADNLSRFKGVIYGEILKAIEEGSYQGDYLRYDTIIKLYCASPRPELIGGIPDYKRKLLNYKEGMQNTAFRELWDKYNRYEYRQDNELIEKVFLKDGKVESNIRMFKHWNRSIRKNVLVESNWRRRYDNLFQYSDEYIER